MKTNLKSSGQDMLHGSLWNKLLLFAAPVAATAILEQLFNASDIAVVGNFTGDGKTIAVAAVSANSAVIAMIVNLFIGIALGANVVIANAIGSDDRETVQKAVNTSILMSFIGGVIVSVVGEAAAAPTLRLLNVPDDVFPSALLYLRIYLLGMPFILLYNFEAAIFRSVGNTRAALIVLAVSGVINVVLNLIFVAVFHMTVNGVAIATVISNAVSSVLLFRRLCMGGELIGIKLKSLRIDSKMLIKIIKIGLPAGIQSAVFAFSSIVMQAAINSLGKVVMAASGAAFSLEFFTYSILTAFSQACTTFVGQNFGAGNFQRCKKTLALCLAEGFSILALVITLLLFFGKALLAVFNNDPEVVSIGYIRLIIIMLTHSFSMIYEVLSGYLRGFGISFVPAVLTTVGVCGIRISWIKFVFPKNQTFSTVLTAYPISLSITALLIFAALLYFRPSKRFGKKHGTDNQK